MDSSLLTRAGGSKPLCSGCECLIHDKYYLQTDDHVWHSSCLRCHVCEGTLENTKSCFKRDGMFFCHGDYLRTYRERRHCAQCCLQIDNQEMVMKVLNSVFHMACFNCGICGRILNSGEYFVIHGRRLYCEDEIRKNSICNIFAGGGSKDYRISNEQNPGDLMNSLFIKTKARRRITDEVGLNIGARQQDYIVMAMHKQKRLRTSFKHHQVRVMRTYFSLNHNPDPKDLKTLSEKTGLSKRVLQVWFQNARAKFRRNGLNKSEDTNSQTNEDILDCTLSYSDDNSCQDVANKDENESEEG